MAAGERHDPRESWGRIRSAGRGSFDSSWPIEQLALAVGPVRPPGWRVGDRESGAGDQARLEVFDGEIGRVADPETAGFAEAEALAEGGWRAAAIFRPAHRSPCGRCKEQLLVKLVLRTSLRMS